MSQQTLVLDRIEGEIAVVDVGGRTVGLPRAALPEGAREGDSFVLSPAASDKLSDARARLARLRSSDDGATAFDL